MNLVIVNDDISLRIRGNPDVQHDDVEQLPSDGQSQRVGPIHAMAAEADLGAVGVAQAQKGFSGKMKCQKFMFCFDFTLLLS